MSNSDYQDDEFVAKQLIHNPVIANTQPPQSTQFSLERESRQRLITKSVNGMYYAYPDRLRDARQFPCRAALNPNRVAHV